jgi:hypothetical protein
MKVRNSVIRKLSTNRGLALIMTTLDKSHTIARGLLKDNEIDGDLTKVSMVKAIAQEYLLAEDQILYDKKTTDDNTTEQSEVKESSN